MPTGTTIEHLARFVADLRAAAVPPRVFEKAALQRTSVIAAGLAARLDGGARKVAQAVLARGDAGPARLLAAEGRTTVHGAVLANAAASCAFDWDEILLVGHPGHSAVVVPLALAAARPDLAPADPALAQIAANELAGRLGLATFFGPQNGQNHPALHLVSAAAAAARLLGLDAERTAHALAIALAQPPTALWPAFLGAIESKVLTAAHAAGVGLAAAELAAGGLRGPLEILDHPRGFFARFSFLPVRRALGGLGRAWLSDTLEVKTHAACWYFQAPLDAAAAALAELGRRSLRPADVRRIRCRTTLLGASVHALALSRGDERILPNTLNFRLDLSLALLLLAGRLTPRELAEDALAAREADLRALAAKVEVRHDLAETRRLVTAIDDALDLAGLLGGAGAADLGRAIVRVRREFPGTPGPALADLPALAGAATAILRALYRARGAAAPYDLGDHGEALAGLAPPCGGSVAIELADGRRVETARAVPAGALADLGRARLLVRAKLDLATEIAGSSSGAEEWRAAALGGGGLR